jgi:hypothetical protein
MTVLDIDRLHARYVSCTPETAARFQLALHELVSTHLDLALLELTAHAPGRAGAETADAVCIRDLHVAVELDESADTSDIARRWAEAIAVALVRRVQGDDDIVVYERPHDALVDLVRSMGRGDGSRLWAWQQIGLVARGSSPTPEALESALVAHPELVPTVIAASGACTLPLTASGWLRVAAAVTAIVAQPATRRHGFAPPRALPPSPWRDALIPRLPWEAADDAGRRALAVLLLACTTPSHARDAQSIHAVEHQALAEAKAPGPSPAAHAAAPPATGDLAESGDATISPPPGDAASPPPPKPDVAGMPSRHEDAATAPVEPVLPTSPFGGALFLVHAISALRLVERLVAGELAAPLPIGDFIARLASRVTTAPITDPAVLALSGLAGDELAPAALAERLDGNVDAGAEMAIDEAAAEVDAWNVARLDEPNHGRAAGEVVDLDWVWRRQATIAAERGWIEATFSLDDVDVRLRLAGLDLDPGFVWWLGAVVRYRYV